MLVYRLFNCVLGLLLLLVVFMSLMFVLLDQLTYYACWLLFVVTAGCLAIVFDLVAFAVCMLLRLVAVFGWFVYYCSRCASYLLFVWFWVVVGWYFG